MKTLALIALLVFQGGPATQPDSGVVTGRLLNAAGKPAAGIRIAAMALPETGAPNFGSLLSIAETDKDGQYRLEKVPPGRYYITAGLVDAPTYYPGVSAQSGATAIQVPGGKVVDKIDFTMAVPNGFRVSGRLVVKPTVPNPAPIVLFSPAGPQESPIKPDGTFEFVKVTPGSYTLQVPFGLPTVSLVITDHDITNLEIGNGPGVRVSGRIVSPGTSQNLISAPNIILTGTPVPLAAPPTSSVAGGGGVFTSQLTAPPPGGVAGGGAVVVGTSAGVQSLSARPGSDGTFEFLKVVPGSYTLRVLASGPFTTTTLIVGDKDITGLEINIPFQMEISGRVVMADGSRYQPGSQGISIEALYSNGSMGAAFQPDGSFRLRVPEGEFRLGVRSLPLGNSVQSITSGNTDLLKNTLRIAPGQKVDEVILTIATVPLDSIKGVRFSGRITGLPAGGAANARVILFGTDPGTPIIETVPNSDGTFEFAKVPPGSYTARISGIPNASPVAAGLQRMYVGDDNVSGIQIPLNLRTVVAGKVTIVDQNGKPNQGMIPSASVTFRRINGTSGTSLRPDGTFSIPLEDGDQTISIDRLPPQYTIQSITAGSADLMKSPLKVDKNASPPEIQVRIEFKP